MVNCFSNEIRSVFYKNIQYCIGCGGGWPSDVLDYSISKGIVSQASYPAYNYSTVIILDFSFKLIHQS